MKTLIFDIYNTGHHLEYIHHLYNGAGQNYKNQQFVFIVHPNLLENSVNLFWDVYPNVNIIPIKESEFKIFNKSGIRNSYHQCKLLKDYVNRTNSKKILLLSLVDLMPLLPLICSKFKISGIVYTIFTRKESRSLFKKIVDFLLYTLYSKANCFESIFLLNDAASCRLINRMFSTTKFKFLPDPAMKTAIINNIDIREKYNIPKEKRIFLHFGTLSARKGTLTILECIKLLPSDFLNKVAFIFAGRIEKEIENEFNRLLLKCNSLVQIIVINNFCSYELLAQFCLSSDALLIPYKITSNSSGLLGYSALYNIKVIAPAEGLLGNLVRYYNLGYTIKDLNKKKLSDKIIDIVANSANVKFDSNYLEINNEYNFVKTIID